MNSLKFEQVLEEQLSRTTDILGSKADEYATDDERLHNFHAAAALQGCTPRQALAGFMAKHTVSIYDMARSDEIFPLDKWDEKITDHINYLILLRAVVVEEQEKSGIEVKFSSGLTG